ncbi:MAG: hypothetical protein KAW02_00865, partial [candidate division Zixibacteria bacterium]|nr:hypothetical protein [candidate division Zixibacteria bacterium]
AVVPDKINYQGKLTTASGGCLNDTISMTFAIYSDDQGAVVDWTETQNSVIVKEGIFNVLLGSVVLLPASIFDGSAKYLGVQVESDPEMSPLKPMVSVGYAYTTENADKVDGYHAGNSSGQVSVSNGTKCTNLNADRVDGYHAGNSSGQVSVNNGTKCTNLNADRVDGYHAGNSSGQVALSNGSVCSNLNADKLDGQHASAFAGSGHNHCGQTWNCGTSGGITITGSGANSCFEATGSWPFVGYSNSSSTVAVLARNTTTNGTGLAAAGNNQNWTLYASGCGVSATGYKYGVYSVARASGNVGQAGGYFSNDAGGYARVAYRSTTGTNYKIIGVGSVSTIVSTSQGRRSMICPESPEAWFEDFGTGEVVDGHCRVELDPLFLESVTIEDQNPLMVFVQMTSSLPNGYYVVKDAVGFEVIEEKGGTSKATFDYRVVAKRAGWENVRFDPVDAGPEVSQVIVTP